VLQRKGRPEEDNAPGDNNNVLNQITPDVPVTKAPLFSGKPNGPPKATSASKPALFASGTKGTGGGLFSRPAAILGKKKFQLDVQAPTESEI